MIKSAVNLVIQIVVVVAAVIVFAYFDPFGLLSPKKRTLEDTPITVTSIREIGQLVTAEYYGEVLSSLQDTLIQEVRANDTEAGNEFVKLNAAYVMALKEFYTRKDDLEIRWHSRRKDLINAFYEANSAITNNVFYQDMITLVLKKHKGKYGSEGDLLLDLWKMKDKELPKDFADNCIVEIAMFRDKKNEELNELTKSKSFKKRQIIVLGRGWVRAGIDFGKFTDRNFKYDRANRIVYLLGMVPSILDCDINPWFIPERKIKGFEIIAATNKANDPDYLIKVKTNCLNKLRAQAETNGIIQHAKVNAEESLKNFLSLLLNEPIDEVRIMENPIDAFNDLFPKDKIISKERLSLLDSMLLSVSTVSYDTAFKKVEKLATLKWDSSLKVRPVSRYSYLGYYMAEDELLSSGEWEQLTAALRQDKFSKLDSIWFLSPENYRKASASAKTRVPAKVKYTTEAKFWMDSVLHNSAYQAWLKAFDSIRSADVITNMKANRDAARMAYISFLKENIKTIKIGDVIVNSPDKIRSKLDSLANKHR